MRRERTHDPDMYEIVIGIDDNENRARIQAEEVLDMPFADETVHVTLQHTFQDAGEDHDIEDVAAVQQARETLTGGGLDVSLASSTGNPADGILDTADERDADLIVVAGRKRTPTGKVLFGSVTQRVVLDTDRPVLVCSGRDT
ncbi:universal stress protein [Haloarcula pelagica]|uniref:universal stress protein n=2 Tax=Haloarcula TaxID=2237 RepID=UPI0024C344A8|nr:universal stress protein [Halomicroarcula sp. YJ-61-S]